MGMQRCEATGQRGADAYGNHSKGSDKGIVLWTIHTCGLVKRDAVPCEHMAAIVVSSRIGVLTRHKHNIMPFGGKGRSGKSNFLRR